MDAGKVLAAGVIPDGFVLPCPKERFDLVRASTDCESCEAFKGVLCLVEGLDQDARWSDQHRILCAHIISRSGQMLKDKK